MPELMHVTVLVDGVAVAGVTATDDRAAKLLRHCREAQSPNVKIREPYIPLIPDDWNGILVLGEQEDLSESNAGYVGLVSRMSPEERYERIARTADMMTVVPWHSGELKLALAAAFSGKNAPNWRKVGLGNANFWSVRKKVKRTAGELENPSTEIKDLSARLWEKYLDLLNPKMVIVVGDAAEKTLAKTKAKPRLVTLARSTDKYLQRTSRWFEPDDLLSRYPEVSKAAEELAATDVRLDGRLKYANRIFFACHAVSRIRQFMKENGWPET